MASRMMCVALVAVACTAGPWAVRAAWADEGQVPDVTMPELIDPGSPRVADEPPAAANTGADTQPAPAPGTATAPELISAPGTGPAGRDSAAGGPPPAELQGRELPPAEDVLQDMLNQQQAPPIIEPTLRPGEGRRLQAPTASVDVDHAVLGVAPGSKAPTLRREGEFIVARRGRLARAADGSRMLFVFDADDKASPEAPLILLPCQMLQSMEEIVQQRGDRVVFILSGQITTYRGANYLMPTMMKLAIDRGNLQ